MSGSLKRALGLWVASKVSGLHVYADDLANTKAKYPACTVAEVSRSMVPMGCGKKDHSNRDGGTGWVNGSGRVYREETAFRLTLNASSPLQCNGQAMVESLLGQIEAAVLEAKAGDGPVVLTDTEAQPAVAFSIEHLALAGTQAVPADTTGEPFLYRGALTLKVTRLVPIERPVAQVMQHIHLEEQGAEQ
jgi:hypothetical protein